MLIMCRFKLATPGPPLKGEQLPMIRALDAHPYLATEFIAGTDGCDIWEVDKDPRIIIEGHEDDLHVVAAHPTDPCIFATACGSGKVRVWSTQKRDVVLCANMGFCASAVTFSEEPLDAETIPGWEPKGVSHIEHSSASARPRHATKHVLFPFHVCLELCSCTEVYWALQSMYHAMSGSEQTHVSLLGLLASHCTGPELSLSCQQQQGAYSSPRQHNATALSTSA